MRQAARLPSWTRPSGSQARAKLSPPRTPLRKRLTRAPTMLRARATTARHARRALPDLSPMQRRPTPSAPTSRSREGRRGQAILGQKETASLSGRPIRTAFSRQRESRGRTLSLSLRPGRPRTAPRNPVARRFKTAPRNPVARRFKTAPRRRLGAPGPMGTMGARSQRTRRDRAVSSGLLRRARLPRVLPARPVAGTDRRPPRLPALAGQSAAGPRVGGPRVAARRRKPRQRLRPLRSRAS